jgi:CrcB protein
MQKLALIGIGGFLGAISRYVLDSWIMSKTKLPFPMGTMVVNITGSFFLGVVFVLTLEKFSLAENYRLFLGVGFIGAYTTFSTYMLESYRLLESSSFNLAFFNIAGSITFGFVAVYLGILAGRLI